MPRPILGHGALGDAGDAPRASFDQAQGQCGQCHIADERRTPIRFATEPRERTSPVAGTFSHANHLNFREVPKTPARASGEGYRAILEESCSACHAFEPGRPEHYVLAGMLDSEDSFSGCQECHGDLRLGAGRTRGLVDAAGPWGLGGLPGLPRLCRRGFRVQPAPGRGSSTVTTDVPHRVPGASAHHRRRARRDRVRGLPSPAGERAPEPDSRDRVPPCEPPTRGPRCGGLPGVSWRGGVEQLELGGPR